jgi:hypothetical protein
VFPEEFTFLAAHVHRTVQARRGRADTLHDGGGYVRHSLALALATLIGSTLVQAQTQPTTRLIPYESTAISATGAPLTGPLTVTFELYEEPQGGAPLWRETQQVEADANGRYLAYLGAVAPMPQIAFSEERARWLAVHVNDRELPRVMLVAVPYALRAADADSLGGQPATALFRRCVSDLGCRQRLAGRASAHNEWRDRLARGHILYSRDSHKG